MSKKVITYLFFTVLLFTQACIKDKVPTPCPEPEPTKWELISGDYKVYDTLGVFLYDMSITHIATNEFNNDSLKFENFDGEFTFVTKQTSFTNDPETLVTVGYHDTLYDFQGKRWKLLYSVDTIYNNVLVNDTLWLSFGKTNLNYYLQDLVSYYACDCKQIAVKQH